ncbi:MAG: RtcB family protein [Planctomycetota bacterium]|nr:RtcB family protein [Planctomycetota bacterium]
MEAAKLTRINDFTWRIEPHGATRVPAVIYADSNLLHGMDEMVERQLSNVAALPGIVRAAYAMPDAHWGYGFPIGGVAAFDPAQGGVVSAGGVGFDISCGVRTLTTGLKTAQLREIADKLADTLYARIPAGVASTGAITLDDAEMTAMLQGGARWAVARGWGDERDLARIEEAGCMAGADPAQVSPKARERQRREMGTLGSGNHYLEVQRVEHLYDEKAARALGLRIGEVVVTIHCGSRGLGHQIGTEFLREMVIRAPEFGLELPDRELACAPIESELGRRYLGAMRAGINCALANREILTHLTRDVFREFFPDASLELLYDVSHNTCKEEAHLLEGRPRRLFVHRKGATRAWWPGHEDLPPELRPIGQPVLIGGSMGTESYVLLGCESGRDNAWGSACHGAGRRMGRNQAARHWKGKWVVKKLAEQGILIRSPSLRGVAEEAPGAYKDASAVVECAEQAGLARRVARLRPMICIKG